MTLDCCASVRHLLVALLFHWKMASMLRRHLWRHYGGNGTYRHGWHWTKGKASCRFRIHPKTKSFIRFHLSFSSLFFLFLFGIKLLILVKCYLAVVRRFHRFATLVKCILRCEYKFCFWNVKLICQLSCTKTR